MFRPYPMLAKHLYRFRIEDDSALLVGLGVLILQLALIEVYGSADGDHALVEVHLGPAETA